MNVLSLDCSTTKASAQLWCDGKPGPAVAWEAERARHEGLFDRLRVLLAEAGWSWVELGLYVVGRGPGAYSGLRVSLLAVQALAEPGGVPVMAVSSMEAMALGLMVRHGLDELTVVGDARRDSFWHGRCVRATLLQSPVEWSVAKLSEASNVLSGARNLVSPHGDSLRALRETVGGHWLDGAPVPTAADVYALVMARRAAGAASDPLLPLYLHPAV